MFPLPYIYILNSRTLRPRGENACRFKPSELNGRLKAQIKDKNSAKIQDLTQLSDPNFTYNIISLNSKPLRFESKSLTYKVISEENQFQILRNRKKEILAVER